MAESFPHDVGITGQVVRGKHTRNIARVDLDPHGEMVAGTAPEPEALVCVPLLVEHRAIGALNVYRLGKEAGFTASEAEVVERFAVMAALAFDSARQREVLRTQARTDGLTGLLNQHFCRERLEVEVSAALAAGRSLGLVVIDLDHFKAINDAHGHAEGDRMLQAVAERLTSVVRATDVAARLGGEGFALILPGAGPANAMESAERARAAIADVSIGGRALDRVSGNCHVSREQPSARTAARAGRRRALLREKGRPQPLPTLRGREPRRAASNRHRRDERSRFGASYIRLHA